MQPTQAQQELRIAYDEATKTNGLLSLLSQLREPGEKYKVKKDKIYSIFKNCPLWEECETKNGHVKFKHTITQTVIGYQNHGGATMDPGGADQLLDNVQTHINILSNEIFGFTVSNWKSEPNYQKAEVHLRKWRATQA